MTDISRSCLLLEMEADQLGEFYPLLQQGFGVSIHVGCTLAELLSEQWGISADYVSRRITTIFVNCRPLDDLDSTIIREGSVIALSGAMPGLVGATMRRGGYYGAMRGGITYEENSTDVTDRLAVVRVKLFNLLLAELGPDFLRRGMIISAQDLYSFFAGKKGAFWHGCRKATLDGYELDLPLLQCGRLVFPLETACLTVDFKGAP